ncbi:hypothetical protein B0H17DRAFT_1188617 [Mycena rosella]|uniref:Uncharacterized protein n=1 Tax=Mycena rosella TaxID=1033263 RepID=A0AAD7FGI7_MYCRO|nr:hypothetical protein B0H17DRAFT_1188617 [Mycena rosella]
MMKFSLPVVRVSLAAALLILLLSSILHFFRPLTAPFGPITLEEYYASLIPEIFAIDRKFEELQALWAPAVLVMRFPDYDNEPHAPIYIDVFHDKSLDDIPSRVDAPVIRDASDIHPLLDTGFAPHHGAFPRPSCHSSTAGLLLGLIIVAFCVVAAGTLFLKRALAPTKRDLARIVPRRVPPATRPQLRSSGETRRSWLLSRPHSKKFRPSLPSIFELPGAAFTFDGAGFLKALESLAREQPKAKSRQPEQNPSHPILAGDESKLQSTHVRAHTGVGVAVDSAMPSKPVVAHPRDCVRTRTAPGQLRLVPASPTRAGAAVRRILPLSPLRLPALVRPPPPRPSTPVAAPPSSRTTPISQRTQLPATFTPGAILYQTSAPTARSISSIIYETPALTGIYSTSGTTIAAPPRCPSQRAPGNSPQHPFDWVQLQAQVAVHRAHDCRAPGRR